jgi:putative transcriptional regulator
METRIKACRQQAHLTQQQLADRAGVRRETIVHLEKGTYNPSLLLAYTISQILGTPIEELFIFPEIEELTP